MKPEMGKTLQSLEIWSTWCARLSKGTVSYSTFSMPNIFIIMHIDTVEMKVYNNYISPIYVWPFNRWAWGAWVHCCIRTCMYMEVTICKVGFCRAILIDNSLAVLLVPKKWGLCSQNVQFNFNGNDHAWHIKLYVVLIFYYKHMP